MGKVWTLVWLLLLGGAGLPLTWAQPASPKPEGRFLRPRIRLGEIVEFELRYSHAPTLEVIFPDSTANFQPFEYVSKQYYPTRTRRGRSLDRTVYRLRTFALDPVQRLALPVTLLRGPDTLTVATTPASVQLALTAPVLPPDVVPTLRQNTTLVPVAAQFNYPFWLAGITGLLLVAGGVAVSLRRQWRRRYQLYKLRKNHVYFLAQYARHIERFTLSRSLANMERAITLWKNYLTGLEDNTISSLTTKEIVAHYQDNPEVRSALSVADRVIYGNQFDDDEVETEQAFNQLRDFAEQRFALVTSQIR